MRTLLRSLLLLAFTFLGSSFAADQPFKLIHVDDLAKLMAGQPQTLAVYDANPPSTREREGIIPGAHLLSSSASFDVAKELPAAKDAKLVFYCANPH
jgi:rhodanese-related sulfurtransferase